MRVEKGNTLAEYGVIGALVAVVCIVGFIAFGGKFVEYMALLKADMSKNIASADARIIEAPSSTVNVVSGPKNYMDEKGTVTIMDPETGEQKEVSLEEANIQAMSSNGKAVLTSGGLGVDQLKLEAQQLQAIFEKLQAEGYDPDNIGWVQWAADNGYTTANRLAESWGSCPPQGACTDWSAAANARLWAETYATGVKPSYVGTDQLGGQQDDLYNVYNAFKNEPGILGDRPAEKAAIIQHLENIIGISKTSGAVLMERTAGTDGDLAVNNNIDYTPYQVEQDVKGINENADGICDNGGGENCKQSG